MKKDKDKGKLKNNKKTGKFFKPYQLFFLIVLLLVCIIIALFLKFYPKQFKEIINQSTNRENYLQETTVKSLENSNYFTISSITDKESNLKQITLTIYQDENEYVYSYYLNMNENKLYNLFSDEALPDEPSDFIIKMTNFVDFLDSSYQTKDKSQYTTSVDNKIFENYSKTSLAEYLDFHLENENFKLATITTSNQLIETIDTKSDNYEISIKYSKNNQKIEIPTIDLDQLPEATIDPSTATMAPEPSNN